MYTIVLLLLAIFSLYIGFWALVRWDASWLRELNLVPVKILAVILVSFFLLAAFLLIYRSLQKLREQGLKRLALISVLVLFLGQLVFLGLIQPMLRYDSLKIFDMAVEMLHTRAISETYETGYFARYTNNYPITILTYWLLLLFSKCQMPETFFMPAVQILNVICITGSVWLGYLIFKELQGRRAGVFFLIICALCPLSYVWAGYYYTSTLSMPCLMGILYLYLRLSKVQTRSRRTFLCGILGIVAILGYKLRATAVIPMIAVVLFAGYRLLIRAIALRRSEQGFSALSVLKPLLLPCAALLLTAVLSLGFFGSAVNHYVKFDHKNTGFPMIHWIMMGARWDGAFDQMDELYTSGFETKEEKVAADKEVLLERIREAGPVGLVTLTGRKLLNTWVDGTDSYQAENSFASYSRIYDYLLGNKSGFLTIYSQAFRVFQMLTVGLAALGGFLALRRRNSVPELFLIQLTFLGAMAFHIIWETNPLYSIGFTFLGLMLLADGIICLTESPFKKFVFRNGWIFCSASFPFLLLLLSLGKTQLVDTPIEERNYCINQYQYAGGYDGLVKDYNQTYVQTFTASRPFNRIAIWAINTVGEYNQSAFVVKLTDENGNILYDNDRFLSGMVVKNTPYEFVLDPVTPAGPTSYTLEITPGYIKGEDSLEFLSYNTGNCDMYSGGQLTVGGELQEKGDLAFSVYEHQVTTYFNIKVYLLLCAGILLLGGGITFLMRRVSQREL